jgi:archaellin
VARRRVQTFEISTQTNPTDLNCPLLNTIYPSIRPMPEPSHHSLSLSESDTEIVPPTQKITNKPSQVTLSHKYSSRADTKNMSKSQKKRQRQQLLKASRATSGASTNQAIDQLEAMDITVAPQKGARSPIKPP